MPKAIVLGAGMVGSVMAADLAADADFQVTIADLRPDALQAASQRSGRRIATLQADLGDPDVVKRVVKPFQIVLGALASSIGFQTLRTVIEAGKNCCDICFMPQDAWELDDLAKSRGVTAVVDCGVAPGMSNMLAGYAESQLDACERIEIYVGGLPRERRWPFQYKAGFSPHDVIEEYTRPARIVEHGRIVIREALSEPELIDFPGIGTLEAFNTDGLRSLAHFLKAPFMKEKTLRYPGHIELMRAFRETRLFSREPISISEAPATADLSGSRPAIVRVRPLDVISALMFPKWAYLPGEQDLTVMRVIVEGQRARMSRRLTWDLLDFYDRASQATSMSRTTAFPAVIVARMIARGELAMPGVIPPELLGRVPGMLERVLGELARRGVHFTAATEPA
jgi:saccharopine dehydrogenase-like NADP-dependent oxidoreductase